MAVQCIKNSVSSKISPYFHSLWFRESRISKDFLEEIITEMTFVYQMLTLHSEYIPRVTSIMLSLHISVSFHCLYSVSILGHELLSARDHVIFMSIYSIPGSVYGKYLMSLG